VQPSQSVVQQRPHVAEYIFSSEPRLLKLKSPVYVFGDFHGNMADLIAFSKLLWPLGMHLTPGSFLFLGDYVDRGQYSIEVLSYLFAQKIMLPDKVFLLRGNHELRAVNISPSPLSRFHNGTAGSPTMATAASWVN